MTRSVGALAFEWPELWAHVIDVEVGLELPELAMTTTTASAPRN